MCPKMFVVFAVKFTISKTEALWAEIRGIDFSMLKSVYNIYDFPTFEIEIDFSRPELSQNEMLEMTTLVENECPVAKHFGISGIGEGIVFKPISQDYQSSDYWFKSKGEKHSTTKVKVLNSVDVEAAKTVYDFVDSVVTEARLEWALNNLKTEQLKKPVIESLGQFIKTVRDDILKEELDTIIASKIDPKKLGSAISKIAHPWYIKAINGSLYDTDNY